MKFNFNRFHFCMFFKQNISLGAYCVPDYYSTLTDQDLRVLYISDVVSVVWYIMYKSPYVQVSTFQFNEINLLIIVFI